jgi:hypothetical protein
MTNLEAFVLWFIFTICLLMIALGAGGFTCSLDSFPICKQLEPR